MQSKFHLALRILSNPKAIFFITLAMSLIALSSAFIAEGFLGLEPCILCVYQRYPFVIAALISILGIYLQSNKAASVVLLTLTGIVFFINSCIAFYHSGVELHWWESAFEACTLMNSQDTEKSFIENIMSAPEARCDQIPWADPIIHLSMANYNVLLCLSLFSLCFIGVFCRLRASNTNSTV